MRYRASDLPPVGLGAFMPIPAITPSQATNGLIVRFGMPGTVAVQAPAPRTQGLPALTAQGHGPNSAQPSDVVPDYILPSIYVASARNMGPSAVPGAGIGMARRRLNELPVPALDPTRIGVNAAQPAKIGGRAATAWPRAFQRFPNRT